MLSRVPMLLVIAFLSAPATAEPRFGGAQKPITATAFGGFSLPSDRYVGSGQSSGFTGLAFGFGLEIRVLPKFYVAFDILHVSKGYDLNDGTTLTRTSLNFVEFPVRFKYLATPHLAFFTGPYLTAIIVSATREAGGVATPAKGEFSNDYGVTVGTWVGFQATQTLTVGVDARYDFGLADIQNDHRPDDHIYTRAFLGMLTLTLGF